MSFEVIMGHRSEKYRQVSVRRKLYFKGLSLGPEDICEDGRVEGF